MGLRYIRAYVVFRWRWDLGRGALLIPGPMPSEMPRVGVGLLDGGGLIPAAIRGPRKDKAVKGRGNTKQAGAQSRG